MNKSIRIYPVPSIRVSLCKNVQKSRNLLVKNDCAKIENIKRKQSQPTERKIVKIVIETLFKLEIKAVVNTAVKAIVKTIVKSVKIVAKPVKIVTKTEAEAKVKAKAIKTVKIVVSNTVIIVTSSIRNIVVIIVVTLLKGQVNHKTYKSNLSP